MSKLLTVLATLKAVLIVAVVTFATGDSLLVILISLLFNLAQLAAKRVDQTVPRDTVLFLSNVNQAADLRAAASSNAGNQSSNM
jgi:hypothetical protein